MSEKEINLPHEVDSEPQFLSICDGKALPETDLQRDASLCLCSVSDTCSCSTCGK
ncbi:MAG: hypothetical protein LBE20_00680 [Deltaproteobacteria bacterium]|nr:hypothetical protein [Deltaproteobacteria bacterium]